MRAHCPVYSISKIAAETVARFAARQWNIPTTIARLNVPYGNNGGWPWFHLMMMKAGAPIPVHSDRPAVYNLLDVHERLRIDWRGRHRPWDDLLDEDDL